MLTLLQVVFHQVLYDLLVPQLHVQSVREQCLYFIELGLLALLCLFQLLYLCVFLNQQFIKIFELFDTALAGLNFGLKFVFRFFNLLQRLAVLQAKLVAIIPDRYVTCSKLMKLLAQRVTIFAFFAIIIAILGY